ncbi:hypothetical protein AB0H76_10910 [Nocardia sp. NPDC050712]|uniref:hypothetical protein n=1 Tax=Nocardia sp. NPDC050712 TaxID=3155518 RepID=UPI0034048864
MLQTRESAVPNRNGFDHLVATDGRSRAMHLFSRVAPGLSDAALAELVTIADQLRRAEGLPPVEFTAQW